MARVVRENSEEGLVIDVTVDPVLFEVTTPYQHILIGETAPYGRGLFLDGVSQSYESDEGFYHAALVQPAMFAHPRPRRVLIAGGGEGATLREVLRHPGVERATMVDIDEAMVEAARRHLGAWHRGAFDDPRARVVIADIRAFLHAVTREGASSSAPSGERFDVAILDLGDPIQDGPSQAGFTVEFFRALRSVLAPGAVVGMQAGELDPADPSALRDILTTLREVFPFVQPYRASVPSFLCDWGFALASATPLPPPFGLGATPSPPGPLSIIAPLSIKGEGEIKGVVPSPFMERVVPKEPGEVNTEPDGIELANELHRRFVAAGGENWDDMDLEGLTALMWLPPALRRRLAKPGRLLTDAKPPVAWGREKSGSSGAPAHSETD